MNFQLVKELMIKDLQETRKNGYVFLSILFLPILLSVMGVIFSAVIVLTLDAGSAQELPGGMSYLPNLFSGILVMIPGIITTLIGSTSIVMEKNNRSLEPLLGTPITDSELFLGKSLAPFLPAMGATYLSYAVFIGGNIAITYPTLGYFLVPNAVTYVDMLFLSPIVGLLGTFASLFISSKVKDVRAAQQVSSMVVLPVLLIVMVPTFTASQNILILLLFGAVLAVAVISLSFLSVKIFHREAILISWK